MGPLGFIWRGRKGQFILCLERCVLPDDHDLTSPSKWLSEVGITTKQRRKMKIRALWLLEELSFT